MPRRTSTNDKPLAGLRRFALRLGWQDLRLQQLVEDDGKTITWYTAGRAKGLRDDLFLQINECPIGQTITYTAAVYASVMRSAPAGIR